MMIPTAASTIGDTWNRRLFPAENALEPLPLSSRGNLPPGWAPDTLKSDDLPRGKVMVVEDEAVVALGLQRLLREAGYRVVGPATTTAEVRRLVDRGAPDCAIVDLDVDRRMPLPVADLLAFADVPFVLLATAGAANIPQRYSDRPVVEKPVARAELIAAVERAMGRRRLPANDNRWQSPALVTPASRIYPGL